MRSLRGGDGLVDSPQGQVGFGRRPDAGEFRSRAMSSAFSPSCSASSYLPAHTRWAIRTPRQMTLSGSFSTARRISAVDSSKRPKVLRYKPA